MERNLERYRTPGFGSILGVDPFGPFSGRRGLLDNFFDNGFSLSGLSDIFDSDFGVKTVERGDKKEFLFALPGIEKENVSVDVSGFVLSVTVDQRTEDSTRTYSSKVTLSSDLDREHIEAELKNGLLKVTVPYLQRRSFKVAVNAGEEDNGNIQLTEGGKSETNHPQGQVEGNAETSDLSTDKPKEEATSEVKT